jgi:hypothetical protein
VRVVFAGRRKTGRLDLEAIEMLVRSTAALTGLLQLTSTYLFIRSPLGVSAVVFRLSR